MRRSHAGNERIVIIPSSANEKPHSSLDFSTGTNLLGEELLKCFTLGHFVRFIGSPAKPRTGWEVRWARRLAYRRETEDVIGKDDPLPVAQFAALAESPKE